MDAFPNMSLISRYVTFSLMSMPRPKHVDQHSFYDHRNHCVVDFFAITRATLFFFFFFYHPRKTSLLFLLWQPSQLCVYYWDQTLFAYFGHFFICFLSLLVTSSFVFSLFWSLLYDIFYFGHFFIISFPHLAASCVYLQFLRPDLFWSLLFIILVTVL